MGLWPYSLNHQSINQSPQAAHLSRPCQSSVSWPHVPASGDDVAVDEGETETESEDCSQRERGGGVGVDLSRPCQSLLSVDPMYQQVVMMWLWMRERQRLRARIAVREREEEEWGWTCPDHVGVFCQLTPCTSKWWWCGCGWGRDRDWERGLQSERERRRSGGGPVQTMSESSVSWPHVPASGDDVAVDEGETETESEDCSQRERGGGVGVDLSRPCRSLLSVDPMYQQVVMRWLWMRERQRLRARIAVREREEEEWGWTCPDHVGVFCQLTPCTSKWWWRGCGWGSDRDLERGLQSERERRRSGGGPVQTMSESSVSWPHVPASGDEVAVDEGETETESEDCSQRERGGGVGVDLSRPCRSLLSVDPMYQQVVMTWLWMRERQRLRARIAVREREEEEWGWGGEWRREREIPHAHGRCAYNKIRMFTTQKAYNAQYD